MTIYQQGQINATAQVVPDLFVQVIPPSQATLNGVPSNVLGICGTAQWGPVGAATPISAMSDYAQAHGAIQNRKYDMGTAVAIAVQQGANNMRCTRVTDGTDVAATATVQTTGLTLTAKYTGTLGNQIQATIANGSAANSFKLTLALPGFTPEVFDNITGTGNAFWVNAAAAINNGNSDLRGKSDLVVAAAGALTAAPVAGSVTLTGGTDGAATITGTVLIGTDGVSRKGMYAWRGAGISVGMLADCDDSTTWATQAAFGLAEGVYMVATGPAGDSVGDGVTTGAAYVKKNLGIDSYALKLLFGDWIYWADSVNSVTRLVSPQAFSAGLLANINPASSGLNKQVQSVVGTQRSAANKKYSQAELTILGQAGLDLICNPVPGGAYFGMRFGRNTSSSQSIRGDNYTRMTNYLAASLNSGMGQYVGQLQSQSAQDTLRPQVKATLDNFLLGMKQTTAASSNGMIDDYNTKCDLGNNPATRIAAGYLQADVSVRYLSVVENFIINLQGGQNVDIVRTNTTAQ
ncbi:phage tail protein [Duganella sp. FT80W]|uniref:Phage tail protein n=1 Tax=Duganella guangzhouensis TaxID=2666084 RepID=A0A6I2KXF9_9BURK|nr:phage tail protein [Duganella guangzhouensis]MRW88866.1 phage tail protein [Duganella guangzhouensis]